MPGEADPAVGYTVNTFGWHAVHDIQLGNVIPSGLKQFTIVHGDKTLVKNEEILRVAWNTVACN